MKKDKFERVHKIYVWARERYTTKGKLIKLQSGGFAWEGSRLTTHINGKPTAYTRIIDAAADKYILNIKQ